MRTIIKTPDELEKFFDAVPQSRKLGLTREEQAGLHEYLNRTSGCVWWLLSVPAVIGIFLLAAAVDPERRPPDYWGALAIIAALIAAAAVGLHVWASASTKKELRDGKFPQYAAFFLETMESCPAVEIHFQKYYRGYRQPASQMLRIYNRSTDEEARFDFGMDHVSDSMKKSAVIVLWPRGDGGSCFTVFETGLFAKVSCTACRHRRGVAQCLRCRRSIAKVLE